MIVTIVAPAAGNQGPSGESHFEQKTPVPCGHGLGSCK